MERKLQAIQFLDEKVIKVVYEGMKQSGEDFRMLITPDHPTPISIRTHSSDPVPYMIYDSTQEQNNSWNYNEKEAKASGQFIEEGYTLMEHFLQK